MSWKSLLAGGEWGGGRRGHESRCWFFSTISWEWRQWWWTVLGGVMHPCLIRLILFGCSTTTTTMHTALFKYPSYWPFCALAKLPHVGFSQVVSSSPQVKLEHFCPGRCLGQRDVDSLLKPAQQHHAWDSLIKNNNNKGHSFYDVPEVSRSTTVLDTCNSKPLINPSAHPQWQSLYTHTHTQACTHRIIFTERTNTPNEQGTRRLFWKI